MASLCIISNEENFSQIICKNPASGMTAFNVKKGVMFGYYSSEDRYNIVFFDGADEISFTEHANQEFEYLDNSRYDSPLFLTNVLKEMLNTPLKTKTEFDHPGKYKIVVTSLRIRSRKFFDKIFRYFKDFNIELVELEHEDEDEFYRNYHVEFSVENKTFHELLNFVYIMACLFIEKNSISIDKNGGISSKLVKAANIISAPYYVKYLINNYYIKADIFASLKDELNKDDEHVIKFKATNLAESRLMIVMNQITDNKVIVDIGCGEGAFLNLAKKTSKYIAIDIDEKKRITTAKKAERKGFDNVEILESIDDFESNEDYIAMLNEVIEHNDIEVVSSMLRRLLHDKHCKKIIVTTPNKDFNKFYMLEDNELRHPDHKFEMTEKEAEDFFRNLGAAEVKKHGIGDEVDGITPTIMFVLGGVSNV